MISIHLSLEINHQSNQIVVKSNNIIFSEKKSFLVFDKNEIIIGEENENTINILETKEREIKYNQKQYKLTQQELLVIYLELILNEIEKNYIIKDIQIQNENNQFEKVIQLLGFNEKLPQQ